MGGVLGRKGTNIMSRYAERAYREVGERIADARYQAGRRRGKRWTQREVAKGVGVAEGTVTAWEAGVQVPEGENLFKLAELLEVSPAWVLRGEDEEKEESGERGPERWLGGGEGGGEGPLAEWEVLRLLGGIAPPGEAQDLKADQLQLIRRAALRQQKKLPGWWYDVLRRVDAGEL
jgi:transcriptional regulator with XRE-family HTH domain